MAYLLPEGTITIFCVKVSAFILQKRMFLLTLYTLLGALLGVFSATAETANIAVSTNFMNTMKELKETFELKSGHKLVLISGSSGQLYAQAIHGAPIDVFMSADQSRAEALEVSPVGVRESRFTYALGQLVLWGPHFNSALSWSDTLKSITSTQKIAIASPEVAPYGEAAMQILKSIQFIDGRGPQIVMGQNVGQAYAMVSSGNANIGLIAKSYFPTETPHVWNIPNELFQPIKQDMLLLKRGEANAAATAFISYMRTDSAKKIIQQNGYNCAQ